MTDVHTAKYGAIGTVVAAIFTCVGVVLAAWIGLSKPSEKQVVDSEQYKAMVNEKADLRVELSKAQSELQAVSRDNAALKAELLAARQLAEKTKAPSPDPAPPTGSSTESSKAAGTAPAVSSSSGVRRTSLDLRSSQAVRTPEGLTATLLDVNRQGATLVINGHKVSHLQPGRRLVVASAERENCFVEIVSFTPSDADPLSMRLDHVCEPKRR